MDNQKKDDFQFGMALLYSLTSPEDLSNHTVDNEVMQFIRHFLEHRTNNNVDRVEEAMVEICKYI